MAKRLSSRSNIPLKTTFQARARPAMRTVTMPISSIGFFMIQASNGVQIRMASSSKPMAWKIRSVMDLLALMAELP
ncbi:hypothetical protein D3C86_2016630 [compost metagenome]